MTVDASDATSVRNTGSNPNADGNQNHYILWSGSCQPQVVSQKDRPGHSLPAVPFPVTSRAEVAESGKPSGATNRPL